MERARTSRVRLVAKAIASAEPTPGTKAMADKTPGSA